MPSIYIALKQFPTMLRVTVVIATLWLIALATAEDQRKELKDEIDEANQFQAISSCSQSAEARVYNILNYSCINTCLLAAPKPVKRLHLTNS